MRGRNGGSSKPQWLWIKHRDAEARDDLDIVGFTILLLCFLYREGASLAHESTRALRQAIGDRAEHEDGEGSADRDAFFLSDRGKRLPRRETRVSIQFQETHSAGPGSTPNRLDIILQGEAGMRFGIRVEKTEAFPAAWAEALAATGDHEAAYRLTREALAGG